MFDYVKIRNAKIRRKKKIKARLIIFSILLVIILIAFFYVMHLKFFQINNVYIAGANLVDRSNLTEFLNEKVKLKGISKLLFGEKNLLIFYKNKGNLIEDIYKKYPSIKSLNILDYDFNGEIGLSVEERKKYGIWCIRTEELKDNCSWIDESGIMFMPAPRAEGGIIKKVIDISNKDIEIGENVLDEYHVSILKRIFEFIDYSEIRSNVLLLKDRKLEEIETYYSNPKIYFSLRYDPFIELSGIQKIYDKLDDLEYIDLRVKNRVYYK